MMGDPTAAMQGLFNRGIVGFASDLQSQHDQAYIPRAHVGKKLELGARHTRSSNLSVPQIEFAIAECQIGISEPNLKYLGGHTASTLRKFRGHMFNKRTRRSSDKTSQTIRSQRLAKLKKGLTGTYKSRLIAILAIVTGLSPAAQFRARDGPGMMETIGQWRRHWDKTRRKASLSVS